jgi:hypothetical protein
MVLPPPSPTPKLQFSRIVRDRFLAEMSKGLVEISDAVQERLTAFMDEPTNARESQTRREVWVAYKRCRPLWIEDTTKVWKECMEPTKVKAQLTPASDGLELVGADVVENQILASRMVVAVMEKVGGPFDDLRIRMRLLEGIDDLLSMDLFRPEVLVLMMVEKWATAGMPAASWAMVTGVVQRHLIERLIPAYRNANDLMITQGILPTIELKDRVKASVRRPSALARPAPFGPLKPNNAQDASGSGYGDAGPGQSGYGGARSQAGHGQQGHGHGDDSSAPANAQGGFFGGRLGWGQADAKGSASGGLTTQGNGATPSSPTPFWKQASGGASGTSQGYGTADETRMLTSTTPLARARSRAQGMIGQIRRLFVSHGGGDFVGTQHHAPSPALVAALAPKIGTPGTYAFGGTVYEDYSPAGVVRVATDLRRRSDELKKTAETKGEKATIEIVALMFQAILAEERIASGIRVWFARLQMPVLRMALEDPDFLGTTNHPARLLIDRMGSCVMGFDATGVQGTAMETEIKRIVQVIEQYPETGKKVYQVVFDEFQKFLSKFLTEKGPTQKVVSVAQQVEQKETLTIQYTIEMRNMLKDMPVRDEIRSFLFKVWAEVLAVSAVRKGPQHADTLTFKITATDLLWAASAKPSRTDRARVIQELPNLLLRLRSGMTLLAMAPAEQDAHIKTVSDTLADAFLSKTPAIPQGKIDAMAKRLGNLEDFVSEDGLGDLPLDAESIEMMLGIDASDIEVVANGGSKPTDAMLAWAQELQVGGWYTLDHNKQISQVQFAWCSERKHLNLFAAASGKSFLIQAGRLAAYLQAGLLLPQEEESLTVRATRDALTKLEANPERLLA